MKDKYIKISIKGKEERSGKKIYKQHRIRNKRKKW